MKKRDVSESNKPLDKQLVVALLLAVFGILLFIALALTLPGAFVTPN